MISLAKSHINIHTVLYYYLLWECLLIIFLVSFKPDGYFNPEVVKYRQLCAKSQRKRRLYSLQQYYHRLLKQILVSRKVNDRQHLLTVTSAVCTKVVQNCTTVELGSIFLKTIVAICRECYYLFFSTLRLHLILRSFYYCLILL